MYGYCKLLCARIRFHVNTRRYIGLFFVFVFFFTRNVIIGLLAVSDSKRFPTLLFGYQLQLTVEM